MKQGAGKRLSEAEADREPGRVDLWQLQEGTKTSWRMSWGPYVCRASVHLCACMRAFAQVFASLCVHAQ